MLRFLSCRGAVVALAVAAFVGVVFTPIQYPETESVIATRGQTALVQVDDVFTADEQSAIARSFSTGGPPQDGLFLRGRHGVTHFILDGSADRLDHLVVLAHGLGTSSKVYDDFVAPLLAAGYAVLRYDYFGHGWSVSDDKVPTYDKQVVLDQLEDLLDHVLPDPATPLFALAGHSTGGSVGALAASPLLERPVLQLFFMSPAFYADKPLLAKIADQVPSAFHAILRRGLAHGLIADAYGENGVVSWGRDDDGNYFFPARRDAQCAANDVMFEHHPFVVGGIFGLNGYILRLDILPSYLDLMRNTTARTLVTWGVKDVVVPFSEERVAELEAMPSVSVKPLEGLGHEGPLEDPQRLVAELLAFLAAHEEDTNAAAGAARA